MEKVIYHIDVNSAYLSWEAVYRKKIKGELGADLRDIPSAVGGDKEKRHGIILAKSIPAKRYNIQTGEPVTEALRKCPELIIVPPHYNLYERCSEAFKEILQEFAPVIEVYSVDEMWCDMTGTLSLYGSPVALANIIKDKIFRELGFSVNVGISNNKLLAKMASDFKKPNLVHTLFPSEIQDKMWHLPVRDLFFVGSATERKLRNIGIFTIGQLAQSDLSILKSHLKSHGEVIWNFANGICDDNIIATPPQQKGYGNSTTVSFDVTKKDDAKLVLMGLTENVCSRLRKDNVAAGVISIELCDYEFNHSSHQEKLLTPSNTTNELYNHVVKLFDEKWNHVPLRKLGVRATNVISENITQLNLFDLNNYEKSHKLDSAIDQIRLRFGNDSIMRATFLKRPIEHMIGGIPSSRNGETEYTRRDNTCRKIFQSM